MENILNRRIPQIWFVEVREGIGGFKLRAKRGGESIVSRRDMPAAIADYFEVVSPVDSLEEWARLDTSVTRANIETDGIIFGEWAEFKFETPDPRVETLAVWKARDEFGESPIRFEFPNYETGWCEGDSESPPDTRIFCDYIGDGLVWISESIDTDTVDEALVTLHDAHRCLTTFAGGGGDVTPEQIADVIDEIYQDVR